jgi:hypothetical protein
MMAVICFMEPSAFEIFKQFTHGTGK